ncbi:O-acetylserine/cysteine efflux transporter [Pseudomonas sp. SJZ085]|uniref:EamA family transporter n=1 Tax=unclassified Pseudomonas TaxID=196821 RepID=UPI001198DFC4|nr:MULTISPECIES: EamA family transporter [unclassified Pseudomonas]TWC13321.1 O-acetylserine/cysteine efflux transporter [Pseudomonas sp. SJZ074]TWC31795.1 O-acetylserine/cysteine efflux transporter [Pseudomonas sp. SJZ085]
MKPWHLALAVLITAIWGINFSVIKLGLATVDPFILAGIRFSLCALPAIFFIRRPDVPWRYLIGYGLVFGIGLWGVVNLGIKAGLSAGIASLILQFSAFFTLLLGGWVFKEALTRFQMLGMLIALGGLSCIIMISDGSVSLLGVFLVLVGAASWSVANIINKKARTRDVFGFLVWSSAFAPIPLFALDYAINGNTGYSSFIQQVDTTAVLSILFQVYPNTLFAYWIWNSLLKTYPVSTVAPLSLLVPIFGMLGSVFVFHESVPFNKVLAVVLIVLGLAVGLYGQRIFNAMFAVPTPR